VEEAARAYAELGERLDAQASYGAAAHAFTQASLSARWAGDLDLAAKAGRRALDYARRFHVRRSEADGLRASANLAILKGAFDEARAFPEASTFPGFTEAMTLGDIAEATGDRQLIERAAPSLDTIGAVPWIRLIVHALRARAYFLAGDAQRAREDVSALAEALGEVTEEQQNLVTATFAVPALDAVRDRWLTEQLYEWLEQRRAIRVAAAGSADRLRGDLALLLNRPDDAERHYREGLAWCRRERCPIEEGRCLQGLAEIAERRVLRQAPRLRSGEPQDERGLHALAMEHLDAAGALFSRYGAKRLLDQVLAKKQILKA
jgi:hypothetical protein